LALRQPFHPPDPFNVPVAGAHDLHQTAGQRTGDRNFGVIMGVDAQTIRRECLRRWTSGPWMRPDLGWHGAPPLGVAKQQSSRAPRVLSRLIAVRA